MVLRTRMGRRGMNLVLSSRLTHRDLDRYVLRAALHEQIANNYYKSISSLGKEETQQKEAVRCINFALAHWQNVGTFLRGMLLHNR